MELSKKVAYLKGLMEGLKIDDSTNEGKILTIMADILDEMSAPETEAVSLKNLQKRIMFLPIL